MRMNANEMFLILLAMVPPFVMSQFVYLIVRLFNFQTCFRIDIVVLLLVIVDTDNDDAKFKPLIPICIAVQRVARI